MQIMGASYVETLDTKGTDGSNVHLGGPATITGYFGGIGQPNDYALRWIDEYLYYYTTYGMRQVLNINPGTVLAATCCTSSAWTTSSRSASSWATTTPMRPSGR